MPKFIKSYSSEARTSLARLIDARTEAAEEVREAQARIARLSALAESATPVRGRLAALDAAESRTYADWSRGDPTAPPPAADTAARVALINELAGAESTAAAAERAIEGMRAEVNAARVKANAADQALGVAVATVALESLAPVADEARNIMARLVSAQMRAQVLARVLGAIQSDMTPQARAAYAPAYAAASDALRTSFDRPWTHEATELAYVSAVRQFLAALHVDPAAALEAA